MFGYGNDKPPFEPWASLVACFAVLIIAIAVVWGLAQREQPTVPLSEQPTQAWEQQVGLGGVVPLDWWQRHGE